VVMKMHVQVSSTAKNVDAERQGQDQGPMRSLPASGDLGSSKTR
jgi:hypothetical protein